MLWEDLVETSAVHVIRDASIAGIGSVLLPCPRKQRVQANRGDGTRCL